VLAVAYLAVGFVALRRAGAGWGIAAGAIFAIAFLVKEIALPLAPVPFLAAILRGMPWRSIARTAGWTLISALVGVSWWFILVADLAGIVYRLGTPAWTLGPIAIALAVMSAGLILASHRRESSRLDRVGERLRLAPGGSGRRVVVLGLTVAWCAGLTLVFAGTLALRNTDLIDTGQLGQYVRVWLPGALKLVAVFGAAGVVLSLAAWRSAAVGGRSAIADLWLATICSAPLVLLVIEVGEPPRNYLAQLGILAALSGAGWLWVGEAALRRLAGWAPVGPRAIAAAVPVALVVVLVGSSAVLGQHALTFRETRTGTARAAAIETAVAWVHGNVAEGETVAIGSFLSYEISLGLHGRNPTDQVRHQLVVGDLSAPDAIRVAGQTAIDDWIAMDIAPRNVNEYQAFSASTLTRELRRSGVTTWIYATEAATSAPEIVDALAAAPGVSEVGSWSWPTPTIPIGLHVYRIDGAALAFPAARLHVSADALARLVAAVEAAGPAGQGTAARLTAEIVVEPASAATEALLARLRAAAGE
jgi:hypothetical protein